MLGVQWQAVQREAQLAATQAAHGVTVLRRANHAQPGLYTQAFFGLSIGIERMGKLIFLVDYAISNGGDFPSDKDLRKVGHNLVDLLIKCEDISQHLSQSIDWISRPKNEIHQGIEEVLSQFAVKLRYYNLNYLAGSAQNQQDPLALWWEKVAEPICNRHYSKKQRDQDQLESILIQNLLGEHSFVIHSTEAGEPINSVQQYLLKGRATHIVQKYSQLYTLQILRWLTSMLWQLSSYGTYKKDIQAFLGLHEPFSFFLNEDKYFRNRKTWSIYRYR